MWTKQPNEAPGATPSPSPSPSQSQSRTPAYQPVAPYNPAPAVRPSAPVSRNLAVLGSSLEIKGKITGEEDLQIDGRVEGPISLEGHRLMVGRGAQVHSEVTAAEVIVYGRVTGNLLARDRVEIKKDGSVIGDITTARISIEDGAYFKGKIEIERSKSHASAPLEIEKPSAALVS